MQPVEALQFVIRRLLGDPCSRHRLPLSSGSTYEATLATLNTCLNPHNIMHLKNFVVVAFVVCGVSHAAPSSNASPAQVTFSDALSSNVFSFNSLPAKPVFEWIHSAITNVLPGTVTKETEKHVDPFTADSKYGSLDVPDYSDKTIWQVIQENEHLTDLKRVLKYSGPGAKELLDDKSKKLTFLIPVNWHDHRHGRQDYEPGSMNAFDVSQWSMIDAQIREFEQQATPSIDEDEEKKHRRKALAYLIDATLHYHAVHTHEPLKAWDIAQNSSVATLFHIGNGKAREIVGNLFDGHAFRLRVGKSVLPRPSAYFNFYSRLVYPDVNVGGSIVHAISLPLLIPPSALQTLFFSQPELAGTSTALLKSHSAGYFRYPFNHSAVHDNTNALTAFASNHYTMPVPLDRNEDSLYTWHHKFDSARNSSHHGDRRSRYPPNPRGQTAITLFTPTNVAWYRVPPLLKVFLMSPFGLRLLSKVLALHTLPYTIFYADFVHSRQHEDLQMISQETVSASELIRSSEWLWGPSSENPSALPMGKTEVTRYTFNTACPKLHYHNHSRHHDDDDEHLAKGKIEFETVDVNVYRYRILPGGRGPLQTRVSVQGVPVTFQDIAVGNGALHTIDRFIMPKGHPEKGIWAHIADQAEKHGFGTVDWQVEAL
jgi:uncharacterized surface protein with fasciclin (FAS1) repeats